MIKWLYFSGLLFTGLAASGKEYFQQRADTKIEVRLDDRHHFLHGFEEITYVNHSPDTLEYIYLHLWPNAYKNDRTFFSEKQLVNRSTAFYYSKPSDRGYIDSLDITVDGQKVTPFSAEEMPDIARIDLPVPLPPGGTLHLSTPFRVKIPKVFSRMGHTGQAYYISQWFPKPAVYDRLGWHPLPYSDQGEFYSELGSYDVTITLPRNYIVMATGNCSDASENAFLDSLSNAPMPEIKRPERVTVRWRDSVNHFPKSSAETKTIHFHEENIHDFAWFADKRLIVRKDTTWVKGTEESGGTSARPIPGHQVTIYAAFLPSEKLYWLKAAHYMKATVQYLSTHVGPYPYNTVKALEGDIRAGGGMEYPTVTVVDRLANFNTVMETIVHEVGHNWFYGLLATNERDDAWMDEGVNTFYENRISATLREGLPPRHFASLTGHLEELTYYQGASSHTDQALNRTSADYTKLNYGIDVYYKAALMLHWLEEYMGKDHFEAAMKDYYETWHYRHPYPDDMDEVFRRHSDKPVGWFFRDVLSTEERIDFSIRKVRHKGDKDFLTLRNRSGFAAPVRINAYRHHDWKDSIWTAPFLGDTTIVMQDSGIRVWRVGEEVPDVNGINNQYTKYGLFHRWGMEVKVGAGWGRNSKAQVYLLPAVGFNQYDGFMAGLLIHNLSLPENKFRYILAPMFGFGSRDFAGTGSLGYFMYPRRAFQDISIQADVKTFHYDKTDLNTDKTLYARFFKVAPSLNFTLKKSSPLSPIVRTLILKDYMIQEKGFEFNLDVSDSLYKPSLATQQRNYGLIRYTHNNNRTLNPFLYSLEGQIGQNFAKINVEGRIRIDYNQRNKSLYVRAYAGKFFSLHNNENIDNSRYWLTTTFSGINDYLYDGYYIGRSEQDGLAAHQISLQEGGFKTPTLFSGYGIGRSDDWLAAINLKTDLPLGRLPVRLFLDAATYAHAAEINPSGSKFLFEGGLELHILNDILLVHVPLVFSQDYSDYMKTLKSINGYSQLRNSITFSLQLQQINWLDIIHNGLNLIY